MTNLENTLAEIPILPEVPITYFDPQKLEELKQKWIQTPDVFAMVEWDNETYTIDGQLPNLNPIPLNSLITDTWEEKLEKIDWSLCNTYAWRQTNSILRN